MENIKFDTKKHTLQKGESIILYTDGITEAFDINDKLYSNEKLQEILEDTSSLNMKEISECVVKSVHEYSKGVPQTDDITILSLKYNG